MNIARINNEIKALSHADKLYVLQILVQEIVKEENISSKTQKKGKLAAKILQRMADRNALANISDPVKWQREIRQDRPLPDRFGKLRC